MGAIWTVGHSTRTIEDFGGLLTSNGIEVLVDVRSFPGSRRYPHFGSERIRESVASLGIDYVHLLDLGGRRKGRRDSPNTTWRNASFRGYADYMETLDFREGAFALKRLATTARACYFCSEAVPWRCHRSMISDYLLSEGWSVVHIITAGKTQSHTYTEPASIVGGRLTYRPRGGIRQGEFSFAS